MSRKLPVLSSRDILGILRRRGFWQTGQTGSHVYMTDGKHKVTIPQRKEMKKGTLISIIMQSGLTREDIVK